MNQNDHDMGGQESGAGPLSSKHATINDGPSSDKRTLTKVASQASDVVATEAKELGTRAQQIGEEQLEKVKEQASSHMDGFADALRAASAELSRKQSGPAAEFVASAASGLEGLSRSLHGKSTAEMIDTVRQFGRGNPIGFLAGSVLVGLALGRFAAAAPSNNSAEPMASQGGGDETSFPAGAPDR